MLIVKYVYDYNCFYCRFLNPYIEELPTIYDDIKLVKTEWNNTLDLGDATLPAIIVNDDIITSEVVVSSLMVRDIYPNLFNFGSNVEFLNFIIRNPRKVPMQYKISAIN